MAIPFDYPSNNITGIVTFLQYVNTLTEIGGTGFLGAGILIMIGFVAFLATKAYSFDRALGFSAFLTLISAIFLRFLDMINDFILFLVVVFFIASVIILIRERNVEEFAV